MYFGKWAALHLNRHRKAIKRELATLLELMQLGPRQDLQIGLSQQSEKVRSLSRLAAKETIEILLEIDARLCELNLMAISEVFVANRHLLMLQWKVKSTLEAVKLVEQAVSSRPSGAR